nr:MAG TPA: hypothetical protein [Caudoviricetes sp.]
MKVYQDQYQYKHFHQQRVYQKKNNLSINTLIER